MPRCQTIPHTSSCGGRSSVLCGSVTPTAVAWHAQELTLRHPPHSHPRLDVKGDTEPPEANFQQQGAALPCVVSTPLLLLAVQRLSCEQSTMKLLFSFLLLASATMSSTTAFHFKAAASASSSMSGRAPTNLNSKPKASPEGVSRRALLEKAR